ncbi:MAG: hypothetical protein HW391_1239 [Chloroflexi bacterium]|nr:hypothetical protein [Chloroflexota bacterium]
MQQDPNADTTRVPESVPVSGETPAEVSAEPGIGEPAIARSQPIAPAATGPGRSRTRWLIGGGVAAAAIIAAIVALKFLSASPLPAVLGYLPADSAVVVELRPELPGDQRQHLGNFLAHFPGFADQSILDTKIDEALDRLISVGSSGSVSYWTQVEPLLAGPMALSIDPDGLVDTLSEGRSAGFLLVATTDGNATCDTAFGATTVLEAYRQVEIRTPDNALFLSCAVHDRFMLVGDAAAIRAGLDARLDNTGIDRAEQFRTARAALEGDQLATVYLDGDAVRSMISSATQQLGGAFPTMGIPDWTVIGLRVIDDALVVDVRAAPVEGPTVPSGAPTIAPASESRFAAGLPDDTIGLVEVHGVGALAERALAVARDDPDQAEMVAQLEQALLLAGGTANLVGWIQDLGIAVMPTVDGAGGALLVRGTDAATVAARVAQVRNLLILASTGTDITVRDTDHGGVTVTTVDLGDLSALIGGLGVPDVPEVIADLRVSFSFAARDDVLIVGIGTGVVERILDTDAASSLRSTPDYGRAMDAVGSTGDLQVYVAVEPLLTLIEGLAPADEIGAYQHDIKPYLEHLAAFAWASTTGETSSRARFVLTVK